MRISSKSPRQKQRSGQLGGGAIKGRGMTHYLRDQKNRSASSARWLERQLNDPYVAEAKLRGYRSRAAFKLIQLNEKYHFLKAGMRIVDLGAAPGGWSQIAKELCGDRARIIALDLAPMQPLAGVIFHQADFLSADAEGALAALLGGPADLVMSDMAPATTGHAGTDHLRIMALAEAALDFAVRTLAPGGIFLCKLFQGGAERSLLDQLRSNFIKIRHVKPAASRKESNEIYLLATGFRGQGAPLDSAAAL